MCVPAAFVAMGASAATAATLAAVSQVGLIVGGTMMSVNAQRRAMAYQSMQYATQQKAYKDKADSESLRTLMPCLPTCERKFLAAVAHLPTIIPLLIFPNCLRVSSNNNSTSTPCRSNACLSALVNLASSINLPVALAH